MYKLILFDFDGTIANTIDLGIPIYNELARKHKFLEIKSIDEVTQFSLKDFVKNHKISRFKFLFYFREFLKKLTSDMKKVEVYKGMDKVIKKLNKDYRLGIVSSNSKENINIFLEIQNLNYYFDFVSNYNLVFGKSKMFKKIMKIKKLNKTDLIYIGDEVRDIEACKKAGIDSIAVIWGMNNKTILKNKNPTYIVDKPEDILKILE